MLASTGDCWMALVLIIEDDREIRDTLADVFEVDGYDVTHASNGLEGLAQARQQHPDVIVLDLMMPVMDGWQFREEQKRDPSIADVPVVVVSAFRDVGEMDVAAFIPKPCNIDELLETAHRVGRS
jgi:CheY-like chemotaxis protein